MERGGREARGGGTVRQRSRGPATASPVAGDSEAERGPSRAQGCRAGCSEEGARGSGRPLHPPRPALASVRLRLLPAAATADLSLYT